MLGWFFLVTIFGGSVVSTSYLYLQAERLEEAAVRLHVRNLAEAAAALVDVERHEAITRPEQVDTDAFRQLLRPLVTFHQRHPSIQYLWTARSLPGDKQQLVLQTVTDASIRRRQEEKGRRQAVFSALAVFDLSATSAKAMAALQAGKTYAFDDFLYADSTGAYVEARAPLLDATGKMIGYLGVDLARDSYESSIWQVRRTGLITLVLALLVSVLVAQVTTRMRRETFFHLAQVKQAEAEMRVQRDLATKATAAKSELLAIATHDLKNPLSAIAGMAGLMLRLKKMPNSKASAADELEMLDSIHSSAKHMGEIVRGILSNEGLEQGGVVFKPEKTDLAALAREVVRFNAEYAARKRITLETEVPAALQVVGDPKLLREAFDNYVSNAIKYSPAETQVRVSLGGVEEAGEVEFAVRDAGPGLSEADKEKLFQKFKKLTARPTGGETSTGLGLSIVKTIAERHHGRVGCDSELGHGSRFWLRIPVQAPAQPAAESSVST